MKRLIGIALPLAGLARLVYWFLFRPKTRGAKVVLVNGGEILLLRHTYERGIYGLPGGGLNSGEDPLAGLKREVSEELGIEIDPAYVGTVESDAEYKRDTVHVFTAALIDRSSLRPDAIEIAELRWASLDGLPPLGPVTREIIALFRKKGS